MSSMKIGDKVRVVGYYSVHQGGITEELTHEWLGEEGVITKFRDAAENSWFVEVEFKNGMIAPFHDTELEVVK
ncbi:hypothetical protein PMW_208 [Pseudomonas phage phiPMW]|uniref:Uncharacterized protein n=1 Tax=Pseudomonas phage phiPMW TaxID=1815582 RepID=A0A1S5R1Q4_9CAUD|nr:hypothetical protein FDG97_gp142 [Pseudomonas phage phiPMW]ANA49333.1 hypothetical protein PMW_208 [Pseudomonas phage phiPMW]